MKLLKKVVVSLLALSMIVGCSTPKGGNEETSKYAFEVDYLVIGGGVAGLSSAIEAAENGVGKVLLIEKTSNLGGAAFYSGGIFGGYETSVTKALDLHISLETIMKEQMKEKHYILDEDLTKLTLEKSGETIEWLINELGVKFQKDVIVKDGYGTLLTTHLVEGEGMGLKDPFVNKLNSYENIEVALNTQAIELIYENDTVVGCIAMQNGEEIRIKAKATLLATGGYSANHELMVSSHYPNKYFQTSNFANQSGDGLIMASNIGAGTANLDQLQVYIREYNNAVSQTPYYYTIFAGQDGKRFMDEKRTAQTYNQEIKDDVIDLYGRTGVDYFWSIADYASLSMMGIAEKAKEHVGVIYADTIEELAEKTGMNKENLVKTIADWNKNAANQKDSEFGRTAPFWFPIATGPYYALQTTFFSSVCHGGITKNANAQVTRIDNSPIKGLYAAGEVATVTNSNGYTISNAITFGRIAANHAIKYMQGEVVFEDNKITDKPKAEAPRFDMSKKLADGVYLATVDGQEGQMSVETTISGGKISNVQITSNHETPAIAADALAEIPTSIVTNNSVNIDTISGATLTSNRILDAVTQALVEASK